MMSYLCQKCTKMEITDFVSEIKRVENYPSFEKNWRTKFNMVYRDIEGESTEANYLSHSLYKRVCCVYNSKCYQRFNKI